MIMITILIMIRTTVYYIIINCKIHTSNMSQCFRMARQHSVQLINVVRHL